MVNNLLKNNINGLIKIFVEQVKKDKVTEEQMISIYEKFKKHKLSDEEVEWAKHIAERIKRDELTEEMLIEKANNWLNNK